MKSFGKILLWSVVVFVLIQFIPVDRTNPPIQSSLNFVNVEKTPQKISEILKNSCYDCHSFETKYPKYAYVAPISWSVKHHINEGREHVNFSIWTTYNRDLKKNIMEKAILTIEDGKMPMPGYITQHPEAKLSAAERKILMNYFEEELKENFKN